MMLANFFVIGAPRSGTTSLYEYLGSHPEVVMTSFKEPSFYTRPMLDDLHPLGGPASPRSIRDDAESCDDLARELAVFEGLSEHWNGEPRLGEASALYLAHPTAAWHIKAYVPDAPLVVVLRDPAHRAFSHLLHGKRVYGDLGLIDGTDRTVDDEFERALSVAEREGMPTVTTTEPEIWVRSGYYHAHLVRWFELFPREQFAIFLYDDLVRDARGLMASVFEHIGVDPTFSLPTTEAFNAAVVPRNQKLFRMFTVTNPVIKRAKEMAPARARAVAAKTRNRLLGGSTPPFEPELRDRLRAIYRQDIEQLQSLIDRDLSYWLDPPMPPSS
jgi:hypothetical protein